MTPIRALRVISSAVLLALGLAAAGCGVSTDPGAPSAAGARSDTYGATRSQAPPAPSEQPAPAPWHAPRGTLVLVLTAGKSPYASLALTLSGIELRQAKTWVTAASAGDLAALNKQPVDLVAAVKTPLLLGVGSAPAKPCHALRLRFEADPSSCWLRTAGAPKHKRALALPKGDSLELPLQEVALGPGRTTVVALSVDWAKVAVERDTYRLTPEIFAPADASKVVGAISGSVTPPTSLARVWACWAKPAAPINWADVNPADGAFTIPHLPPGRYFLRVTAGGYEPVEDRAALYHVKVGAEAQAAPVTLVRRPR